jgi:HEAT repeat protein
VAFAQVSFETTVAELASADPRVRLRAARLLNAAGYPEAAVPVGALLTDSEDELQLEAIAAELNFFLAHPGTSRRRRSVSVEVRGRVAAEPVFSAGPGVLAADRVPLSVALGLAAAATDRTPRVAAEALYALGSLAGEVPLADRPRLLSELAPTLAGMVGAADPAMRLGAVRVIGRIYAWRPTDPPVDERLGDAVIGALNDPDDPVRETAMWALGMMRNARAVQALSQLFTFYRKGPLAERALDALAHIGHEAAVPLFLEQLNGRDLTHRLIAIEGLARVGDRVQSEAVQRIIRRERNEAVLLGGHFANVLLADGTADAIVAALGRDQLRLQAFQYVIDLGRGRSSAVVRGTVDPNARIRVEVADALGLCGDASALPVLRRMATDPDPDVVLSATRAIARLSAQ